MKIQCNKPCYDCPFRNDIVPYQTYHDVACNTEAVLNVNMRASCHYASLLTGTKLGSRDVDTTKIVTTCAGFLIMRQRLGIALPPDHTPIKDQSYIFDSLEEFQSRALCASQELYERWLAWQKNRKARGLSYES